MSAPTVTRDLFGGAIKATTPSDLVDASDFRQVPDTQEVFMYPNSGISIIVEILQRVEPSDPKDAITFHFNSLAHDNAAQSSRIFGTGVLPTDGGHKTPPAITLSGEQVVIKFNRQEADEVRIHMALYRIEIKDVDLVVTFNVPVKSVDGGAVGEQGLKIAEEQFKALVQSLQIVDYGLFA
ncbi:hypothetical protein AX17_004360 [Amanita inopinata Kibby_2008]|nr:hypothetical protein AX17_004360 [Amanita inopinata Kibby_2008]